jgi:putative FmdB family regulatory protein
MPTYDMVCGKCSQTFEVFRPGFMRDEDRVCPECGSTEVEQAMTGFLTHFGSSSGKSNCGPRMDPNKTSTGSTSFSRHRGS